jgi:hypothetical protein
MRKRLISIDLGGLESDLGQATHVPLLTLNPLYLIDSELRYPSYRYPSSLTSGDRLNTMHIILLDVHAVSNKTSNQNPLMLALSSPRKPDMERLAPQAIAASRPLSRRAPLQTRAT